MAVMSSTERTCWTMDRSHMIAEAVSKRLSVTRVMWAKECFIATYRSALSSTICKSEAITKKFITGLRSRHAQYAEGKSSKNIIDTIVKQGWARIPTEKSIKARSASTTFDLWPLRRDFTFTEIITSAFKTAVRGKMRMLTAMRKIRKAWPEGEIWCRVLAKKRSTPGPALHPAGVL